MHAFDRSLMPGEEGRTRRLRINSPEASLHPSFGHRAEARENGLMLIRVEEDLFQVTAAELDLELWGGHPGTANKRVSINGRSTYLLPEVGTAAGHCTYSYPMVALRITDLVNGWNACQLALDRGTAFWGHAMIDAAVLRVALAPDHPDLRQAGLAGFDARVVVARRAEERGLRLRLDVPDAWLSRVEKVVYQGWFDGYDENGNGSGRDWHGVTRHGAPEAWLGEADRAPWGVDWHTALLPEQDEVAVRALVWLRGAPDLRFLTAATGSLELRPPAGTKVRLLKARNLPVPFWSRAGEVKRCSIEVPCAPARIEAAELQVVAWTGGAGKVQAYFTLNGVPYPVAEGATHEPAYSRLPVRPEDLREGRNEVRLLSDTEHHGIELCLPGPALMIRHRLALQESGRHEGAREGR